MLPIKAQLPSGTHHRFFPVFKNFSEYIEKMREVILKARVDIDQNNAEKILYANSPFEYCPDNFDGKRGMLLVHGLSDSPLFVREIAKYFTRQGFLTRGILLPGHGTVPGDLLDVTCEEWFKAVQYGINTFSKEVQQIYYTGFSTGASMGIYHALIREPLKALLLFAPACKLRRMVSFANQLFGFARWVTHEDKWIIRSNVYDYAKYQSFPMNAAWQVSKIIKRVDELLASHEVTIPMAMVLTADDETIDTGAAVSFFQHQHHPESRLIYYVDSHKKITGLEKDKRVILRNSAYPDQNILDFSHVCLTFPRNHFHYGRFGDYREPIFEQPEAEEGDVYRGALKREHLKKYNFQRLIYNPDIENLLPLLSDFTQNV